MKSYGIMSIVIFCVIFIIIIILISNGISSPGEMGDSGTIGCIGLGFDEMFYTFQDLSSILTQTDAAIGEDERGVFTPPAYASTTKASDKYPFSPYELFGDIVRPPFSLLKKLGRISSTFKYNTLWTQVYSAIYPSVLGMNEHVSCHSP